jgi:hypothetical protein
MCTADVQVKNLNDDTPLRYFDLSSGSAGQDNVAFAAHVAGFWPVNGDDDYPGITSAYGGGGTPLPVPAAAWLLGSGSLGLLGFARRREAAQAAPPRPISSASPRMIRARCSSARVTVRCLRQLAK